MDYPSNSSTQAKSALTTPRFLSFYLFFALTLFIFLSLLLCITLSLTFFFYLSLCLSVCLSFLLFHKGFQPYILALCGSSGTCKSTAVELLCKELHTELKVWTDDSWDPGSSSGKFKEYSVENGSNRNFASNSSQRYAVCLHNFACFQIFLTI